MEFYMYYCGVGLCTLYINLFVLYAKKYEHDPGILRQVSLLYILYFHYAVLYIQLIWMAVYIIDSMN